MLLLLGNDFDGGRDIVIHLLSLLLLLSLSLSLWLWPWWLLFLLSLWLLLSLFGQCLILQVS